MKLYPADAAETTCESECVQALMLSLARPSVLSPVDIELIDLWLDDWCRSILLETEFNSERHEFLVDLARPQAPQRAVPEVTGFDCRYCRYWGIGLFSAAAGATVERLRDRKLGAEAPYAGMVSADDCLVLIDRVSSAWRRAGLRRRSERKDCQRPVRVYAGIPAILRALVPARSPDAEDFPRTPHDWVLLDWSARGFGAVSRAEGQISPKVGTLLGIETDSAEGLVLGVVRRLNIALGKEMRVGIERLADRVSIVRFAFPEDTTRAGGMAVWLGGADGDSDPPTLLLPAEAYCAGLSIVMRTPGKQIRAMLGDVIEPFENFVRVRFTADRP